MREPAPAPPPAVRAPYATYEAFGLALQVLLAPAMTYVYLRLLGLGGWSVGPIVVLIATGLRGRGALRRASWYHCAWGGSLLCFALLFLPLGVLLDPSCFAGILWVAYVSPFVYLLLYAFLALLALVAPSLDRDEAQAAARRAAAHRAPIVSRTAPRA